MKKAIFYTALMAAIAIGSTTGINAAATGKDPTVLIAATATEPAQVIELVTLTISGPETVLYCQTRNQELVYDDQSREKEGETIQAVTESYRDEFWTNWRWRSRNQSDRIYV